MPDRKLVMLSHGLDSTDYVHALSAKGCDGGSSKISNRENQRLGRQLTTERKALPVFDATLGLSNTDAEIHQWLGARHSFWLPRAVTPSPIEWDPVRGRVGFVGRLDHPPNYEGFHRVARIINDRKLDIQIRVVGSPQGLGAAFQSRFHCVQYLGPLADSELTSEAKSWRAFLHPIFCFARGASTKLATGIGWGIPVVASTSGRRGYEWTSGRLLAADSPEAFVHETQKLAFDDIYMREVRQQVLEIANSSPSIVSNAIRLREHLDSILVCNS